MDPLNVGFISTRFAGTDGVSLESLKWADVFESEGHTCYWFAGKLDRPEEVSYLCEHAFFDHPEIKELQAKLWGNLRRPREVTTQIQSLKEKLKDELYRFVENFNIDLIVPQNVLAIPMHLPFGLALTEFIAETRMATIAHHHDFGWERDRFAISCVPDYLRSSFPPPYSGNYENVVINSPAQADLARRRGLSSTIIPNVLDFSEPPQSDGYGDDFRQEIGIGEDEILVLQPTRIVWRKGIEHAIELVRRLKLIMDQPISLVISHEAGDEGLEYLQLLQERAAEADVTVHFIANRIDEARGTTSDGQKRYTLWDIYPHADLVTFPSLYEGFGNAFLEAIYFRKPIMVNRYSIYVNDIEPLGFQAIHMTGLVTTKVVYQAREILQNSDLRHEWAEYNYALALKHFSYRMLCKKLNRIMEALFD